MHKKSNSKNKEEEKNFEITQERRLNKKVVIFEILTIILN